MSREILFLAHRIPFPPDRGDKIRSHHVLLRLAQLAAVHVATFADDEEDAGALAALAAVATNSHVARRVKPMALAGLQALAARRPVSLPAFADAGLRRFVAETLARRPIATIYVFSSQMAQYVPADFAGRVVVDFVDVDSAKFEAYAAKARQPLRALYAREARLLKAFEGRIARRADTGLLVTAEEAALFRARLDPATRRSADVRVLGIGIDAARFDPALVGPEPALAGLAGPHLLFAGQMDYPPNVAAVVRFARRVMPLIRSSLPGARFHVVGRRPVEAVTRLEGVEQTRVWGRVDDMRPWLAAADVVVAPLEIARGLQTKVLEAMAMARPVLASPGAATGIAARDGVELAIGRDDAELAELALGLLGDRARADAMGRAARAFVLERQSWAAMLADLPAIVGLGGAPGARRAA